MQFLNSPPCTSTFETVNGRSWIDFSVADSLLFPFCCHWEVLDEESLSNHKVLVGSMFSEANFSVRKITRLGRAVIHNKIKNDVLFSNSMYGSALSPRVAKIALDLFYTRFSAWCQHETRSVRTVKKCNAWWNPSLKILRSWLRTMRRCYQQCEGISLRDRLKSDFYSFLHYYKTEILSAKIDSWRKFSSSVSRTSLYGLPFKLAFNKLCKPIVIPPILGLDGVLSNSLREFVELILDALYQPAVNLDADLLLMFLMLNQLGEVRSPTMISCLLLMKFKDLLANYLPIQPLALMVFGLKMLSVYYFITHTFLL